MKNFKAFTLVETLIVIVVFCIGILVVLQWLSQTLRNKDYADIQIKSAFLAREWIELMFNLRDANYHKELPWNCIFNHIENLKASPYEENENPFCAWYFWSGDENKILKIWMWTGNEYIHVETWSLSTLEDFDSMFSGYQIYFHTWNIVEWITWYLYDHAWNDDERTRFARYLLITWVIAEDGNVVDTDKLLKIESHVLYKKWYLTGEKVMETFIWNYEFNE